MKPLPTIREATEADIPEMHRIRMHVRENQLRDPGLVQPHDYQRYLTDDGRGWVAELEGRIVGFAIADVKQWSIWALFVDPAAEGSGIGRQLHDTMLEWLFANGAEEIQLSTEPGTRAERFYRAAGWRHQGLKTNGEASFTITR